MALLTAFDTESTFNKQFFGLSQRLVETRNRREVYSTLAEAQAALSEWLMSQGVGVREGAARRINDAGWAECIKAAKIYGEWSGI